MKKKTKRNLLLVGLSAAYYLLSKKIAKDTEDNHVVDTFKLESQEDKSI